MSFSANLIRKTLQLGRRQILGIAITGEKLSQ
jgi:hypothetical protein